mmetsp:Transcript_36591/g.60608  ORF Transcript_36591/g.60608 Transcript_36591/m.60608 type:complete len:88 (+) Transcript_36591:121-384(+)
MSNLWNIRATLISLKIKLRCSHANTSQYGKVKLAEWLLIWSSFRRSMGTWLRVKELHTGVCSLFHYEVTSARSLALRPNMTAHISEG